jgi:hypothetical protein
MPRLVQLHSEPTWTTMPADKQQDYAVVRMCDTRDEAAAIADAILAAIGRTTQGRGRR